MPGAGASQGTLEGASVDVGEGVVGHDRLAAVHAELAKVRKRPGKERRARPGALIGELLDVGVARAVVHGDVQVDLPGPAVSVLLGAPARPVAGMIEARKARVNSWNFTPACVIVVFGGTFTLNVIWTAPFVGGQRAWAGRDGGRRARSPMVPRWSESPPMVPRGFEAARSPRLSGAWSERNPLASRCFE